MRDQIRDRAYFSEYIDSQKSAINKFIFWIDSGKTPVDRIAAVRASIADKAIGILLAEYSSGSNRNALDAAWNFGLNLIEQGWAGRWKIKDLKGDVYDQYILSAYDEMLWMLSLGYLLDIDDAEFRKLVDVIDRDGVRDNLFEFIISAKLKDRAPISEESYREYFGVPEVFATLRKAIAETDKQQAATLVKQFITKEWYTNHKDAGWHNSHKNKHNAYFGYWSFETAAVVKIMGLDDSPFRDCQYYPKDLV